MKQKMSSRPALCVRDGVRRVATLSAEPGDLQLPYDTFKASTSSLAEICEARQRLMRCRLPLDESVLAAGSTAGSGKGNSSPRGASSIGFDVSIRAMRRLLFFGQATFAKRLVLGLQHGGPLLSCRRINDRTIRLVAVAP